MRLGATKQAWRRSEEDALGGGMLYAEKWHVLACYLIDLATSLSSWELACYGQQCLSMVTWARWLGLWWGFLDNPVKRQ